MMGSAALLCVLSLLEAVAGVALDNTALERPSMHGFGQPTAAEAAYGHISTWETSGVTDMAYLFCAEFRLWSPSAATRQLRRLQRGHRRMGHLRRHDDVFDVLQSLGL